MRHFTLHRRGIFTCSSDSSCDGTYSFTLVFMRRFQGPQDGPIRQWYFEGALILPATPELFNLIYFRKPNGASRLPQPYKISRLYLPLSEISLIPGKPMLVGPCIAVSSQVSPVLLWHSMPWAGLYRSTQSHADVPRWGSRGDFTEPFKLSHSLINDWVSVLEHALR